MDLPGPSLRPKKTVAYFYDADVGNYSYGYGHPMKPHRMRMTHNLVANYGLDRYMDILRPKRATREQMSAFHTDEYVDFLSRVSPETMSDLTGESKQFLVGEDCPAFEGLWEFCTISAGGSIAAANRVNTGQADVAINWAGGLHHAKKREASGFCYVNDIVLAILELLRTHLRVLYIDIDIHHGDGVEEAFYSTDRVMTVSFHKFGDFFPGTGDVRDTGIKKGKGYAVNVPLRDGVNEKDFGEMFRPVLQHIMDWYRPGAVVLQCGADSLAGDKLGCFNLSMKGHADCVRFMQTFEVPLIVVGGGGYTVRNVAKTWTYETGVLLNKELDPNLPFNDYIQYFGPEYKLDVAPTNMDNHNSREYLEGIRSNILDNLRALPCAPSVQMQETPSHAINGFDLSDDEDSDLDERISQRLRDTHTQRYGDELSDDGEDNDEWGGMMLDDGQSDATVNRRQDEGGNNNNHNNNRIKKGSVGIAGGSRGSAPWKDGLPYGNASSSQQDFLSSHPKSLNRDAHATFEQHYRQTNTKPKRSFFKARAAGIDLSSGIVSRVAVPEEDFELISKGASATAATTQPRRFQLGGSIAATNTNGVAASVNGGSEAADSPMPSIRDSPVPSTAPLLS
ncbi:hypothetical protein CBS101457_000902 [Exobasidium rhododendri]|nr:hypothetical protein CBS101457_000902 [Exobasidium rhododendri]